MKKGGRKATSSSRKPGRGRDAGIAMIERELNLQRESLGQAGFKSWDEVPNLNKPLDNNADMESAVNLTKAMVNAANAGLSPGSKVKRGKGRGLAWLHGEVSPNKKKNPGGEKGLRVVDPSKTISPGKKFLKTRESGGKQRSSIPNREDCLNIYVEFVSLTRWKTRKAT